MENLDNLIFSHDIPFYWYPEKIYNESILPKALTFQLYYNKELGLLSQIATPQVVESLEKAYSIGSEVIGLMDADGIGKKYADDFIRFIEILVNLHELQDKKVLEIGCGTGYLLHEFQKKGAEVLGYEPGYARIGKYPIRCINGFFPSEEVKDKKFDIIIAYNLLEHIDDLNSILAVIKSKLVAEKGLLILSVPDCETYIKNGDISMLFHEHYSYFTVENLTNLLLTNGYTVVEAKKSSFGGNIHIAAQALQNTTSKPINSIDESLYNNFKILFETKTLQLKKLFELNQQKSIGIYVPIRALNLLYLLKDDIERLGIQLRFFDESEYLYTKYLPCFDISVENLEDFISNPPDLTIIFSYSFGKQIKEKLINSTLNQPNIQLLTINEIF